MKLTLMNPPERAQTLMRRAGYSEYRDPNTGKSSFSKRLGLDFFPKFHAYVEEYSDALAINLHLDQKKPSYEGTPMHGGEYEGPLVEKEIARLKNFIESYKIEEPPKKKGFFAGFFGGGSDD